MQKKYLKAVSALMCTAMCASLAACGGSGDSDSDSSGSSGSSDALEVAYNLTTDEFSVFEGIIDDFTKETGIDVTIYNGGDDYESAMKTRMSSGDLPDVWVTHGWSLIRYSEYMMDLSDQPWVSEIDAGLKEVITNDDGELFILPITQAVAAIMYNKDVVAQAGVDVSQIRTWDDFTAACQTVQDNTEASPILMCLGDSFDSYPLEDIWPTLYTNEGVEPNYADALKDGTFDWETDGREAFEMVGDWFKAGYLNDDFVSGTQDDVRQALANGEGAFTLYSTEVIPAALTYNADANIGIIPVPAKDDNGASYFGIGEGNFSCFGIWKDTKYEDECKQLLEYLAQPEIATEITRIDGGIPALSTIQLDASDDAAYTTNAYKEAQQQFEGDICYDNFFDREYLPSGMWSVMADSMGTLLADGDPDANIDAAVSVIADNYNDLMGN